MADTTARGQRIRHTLTEIPQWSEPKTPCRSFKVSISRTDGTDAPTPIALGVTTRHPDNFVTLPPSARQLESTWVILDGTMFANGGVRVQTNIVYRDAAREPTFKLAPSDIAELFVFDDGEVDLAINGLLYRRFFTNRYDLSDRTMLRADGDMIKPEDAIYPVVDIRGVDATVTLTCSGPEELSERTTKLNCPSTAAVDDTAAAAAAAAVTAHYSDGDAEQDFGLDVMVALAEHTLASTPSLVPTFVSSVSNVLQRLTQESKAPPSKIDAMLPVHAASTAAPAPMILPRTRPRTAARTRLFEKAERVLVAASSAVAAAATASQSSPLLVPGCGDVLKAWGWLAVASGELRHIVRVLAALLEASCFSGAPSQLSGPLQVLVRYGCSSAAAFTDGADQAGLRHTAFASFVEWAGLQSSGLRAQNEEAAEAAGDTEPLPTAPARFSRVHGYTRVGASGEILEYDPGNSASQNHGGTRPQPGGCGQLDQPLSAKCPYFEVTLVVIDGAGSVTVGIASPAHPLNKHPGETATSVGIRTIDGRRYSGHRTQGQVQEAGVRKQRILSAKNLL